MEKPPGKKSSNILSFLTKTGGICFESFPHCPAHEKSLHNPNTPRPNSGKRSTKSIIPAEARTRPSFKHREPVSPKVSCLGEVKHRKKRICKAAAKCNPAAAAAAQNAKKAVSPFPLTVGLPMGGEDEEKTVPGLGQMKQFSSGRNRLGNFKWEDENGCSEDRGVGSEAVSPCSLVPMKEAPKKEINLWKRRSMDSPLGPLKLSELKN
ncbi:hypothetical protein ACLOJK_024614 [Asimina triloba]